MKCKEDVNTLISKNIKPILKQIYTCLDTLSCAMNMLTAQIHGNWPCLADEQLFEARDLMPTTDVREWLAKATSAHWQLSPSQSQSIFPDLRK